MRAFLGIDVPNELKQKITYLQDRFSDFDIKFVEPENLHFNLKFFRDIKKERVEKLKDVLEKVCKQFESFEINISGLGTFPSRTYVRVIWLGVKEGYQNFLSLAQTIHNVIESLGFEKENRFIPHLTLGRVKSGRNKNELLVTIRKLEDMEIGRMRLDKIKLFQSKLSPSGPIYEEVFTIEV